MSQLCITLGHNSSAILIKDEKVICGYENERLSGIKADSQFPELAIEKCLCYCAPADIDELYISHWAINGELKTMSAKHFNPIYLAKTFAKATIYTLSKDFTHHDAHFWSTKCFAKGYNKYDTYTIVADGFGNFGETLSIYHNTCLIRRTFGFETSLGLLYQYATAYLGLKMNQDEYKLLGYGAHISDYITYTELDKLYGEIHAWSDKFLHDMFRSLPNSKYDPLCSIDSLPALRLNYQKRFDELLSMFHFDMNDITKKVIISYFVQSIVEKVITNIIEKFGIDNIILSGGLFLNVRLNTKILRLVDHICVTPLCGDQGAALGLYYYSHAKFEIKDLYWGKRDINIESLDEDIQVLNNDPIIVTRELIQLLNSNHIINIVHGDMEFGPRALCNTSTIALPTMKNVRYINKINDRDQIMPMAPVIVDEDQFFSVEDTRKIHRSLEFMVIAIDYDCVINDDIRGIAHLYDGFSGRPQLLHSDHILYPIVSEFDILINTSFNIHGTPIVFNTQQINNAHREQKKLDIENRIITIYIKN